MRTLLLTLPLLAPSLLAQTQIIPASLAAVDGAGSSSFPFGLSSACLVQNYYHASETGLLGPVLIKSLEVRANGGTANPAKASMDLQITLSTTPATLTTLSSTFANNHGTNRSVAYTRKMSSLIASLAQTPGTFGGPWMLDTPFLYIPSSGNLLVEYDMNSQPSGAWTIDSPFTSGAGIHVAAGTGCNGLTSNSTGGGLGGSLTFSAAGGSPNLPAVLLLGAATFPAPIPIPGFSGCTVLVNPLLSISLTLDASGAASVPLTVPETAALRGNQVHGQFGAAHLTLGLAVSPTRSVTLDAWSTARITNTSTNTSPTGSVQQRSAIVIRIGY